MQTQFDNYLLEALRMNNQIQIKRLKRHHQREMRKTQTSSGCAIGRLDVSPNAINGITNNRFTFIEDLNFAHRSYTFENDPNNPAITMGTTAIRTIPGRDRGIFTGFGLPELPKDFIILFSLHSIATTPTDDENQLNIK